MTATASTTTTLRRRRGLTEEAATAAVDTACRRLRLPTIRAVVEDAVTAATKDQLTYTGFLAELLLAEVDDRDRRSTLRRVKAAGFPREKYLEDFDHDANPNINPATVHTLATGDWIRRGEPLSTCRRGRSPLNTESLCSARPQWVDDPRKCLRHVVGGRHCSEGNVAPDVSRPRPARAVVSSTRGRRRAPFRRRRCRGS